MDEAQRRLDKRAGEVRWLPREAGSRRFAVRGLGHREVMPPCVVERAGGDDHLVMYFHDAAALDSGAGLVPVAAGTAVLWRPGQRHHYGRLDGARWSHTWMHCRGDALGEAIAAHGIACATALPGPEPVAIDGVWTALIREATAYGEADAAILESLFQLLALLLRRSAGAAAVRVPAPIAEARAFIDRHYARPLAITGLAARAGLSPSRFAAGFRRWVGVAPRRYLIGVRLRHAAQQLGDGRRSVAAVAASVGIDDAFYFSRLFKAHHGAAPEAWRRRR